MIFDKFKKTEYEEKNSQKTLPVDMEICQSDYPLDWYQEAFIPYAEEYQALPDRRLSTVVKWAEGYIKPAQDYFGDSLLLLAHYYMGGDIVKIIEHFQGELGDSYQLALKAYEQPEKKVIVESAVHFMAESISILAHPDQQVYITNPKAGCTMEMHAKDYMVQSAFDDLNERYGAENILPVCYMNTSGRIKAMVGAQGGACCTSSNVEKVFRWAQAQGKKILFIPDRHMGENVADWIGIAPNKIAYWPGGVDGANFNLFEQEQAVQNQFDQSELILFCSECGVHAFFEPEMVHYWQAQDYHVVVHPESRHSVVSIADSCGSTAHIWDQVFHDRAGTKKYAVGTENHMVENVKFACRQKGIEVVHVAEAKLANQRHMGCGCATMSRNDPPHLVALLDLLHKGKGPEYNLVRAGDVVNEFSGKRQRLDEKGQAWVIENARISLENMIKITEK